MRVEILRELGQDDPTLEIPWSDPAQPKRKFLDLRRRPQRGASLPECRRYPVWAEFLKKANGPGSPWRTAKSDVWNTRRLDEDEKLDFRLPSKRGCYVDLVLARVESNFRLAAVLVAAQALARALAEVRVQAQMEIAVRRCFFHSKKRWGYYVTAFLHAYGASPREARKEWERAIGAFGDALAGAQSRRRTLDARFPGRSRAHSTKERGFSLPRFRLERLWD